MTSGSRRSRSAPGSVQGRTGGTKGLPNGVYVQPPTIRSPHIDWRAETCPTCGAGPTSEFDGRCINQGTRTGKADKGKPCNPHPSRKRLAIRRRNQRIEAGLEQVITEPSAAPVKQLADRGYGMGECGGCHHLVPLNAEGKCRRHAANGGLPNHRKGVGACRGTDTEPVR